MTWKLNQPFKVRCIDNHEYLTMNMQTLGLTEKRGTGKFLIGLTLGQVYEVLEIEEAFGYYRILDNTNEDYLYPAYMFEPLENQEFEPDVQNLFPIRFGLRLKKTGVLLNDRTLGKWHQVAFRSDPNLLQKRFAYEAAWEMFFGRYEQSDCQPTQDEVRRFARRLAKLFNFAW
jgi:hypothetical protein